MYIKSYIFRLEMRHLFIANFTALKSPSLTITDIGAATQPGLKKIRADADTVKFKSLEMMEAVLEEYVKAQPVWRDFMDVARDSDLENIFQDIGYILHLISDFKVFKENHPDKLFMHETANNAMLMQKVITVLGDGIRKFLDYAIEIKENSRCCLMRSFPIINYPRI